jgi:hypothetical protein
MTNRADFRFDLRRPDAGAATSARFGTPELFGLSDFGTLMLQRRRFSALGRLR